MNHQPAPSRLRQGFLETSVLGLAFSVLALLVVPPILGGKKLHAQTDAPQATKQARQQKTAAKPNQTRRHATTPAASTQQEHAPEAIAAPPPGLAIPITPANQPPNPARVSWDSRGLEIEASNSSLNQILHQVAADTGAKLEGLSQDQRVFGSYGPGPGSEVLSKLLEGSGYNLLIIGRHDTDAPVEIVLSARSPVSPQIAANNQNRSNSKNDEAGSQLKPEPQSESSGPQPIQNPFGNGGPPRDQLQFMQEILQRQQQIDQQQDQQNHPQ
jgi:hypothetical protein